MQDRVEDEARDAGIEGGCGDAVGDGDLVRVHVGSEVVDGVDAVQRLGNAMTGLEVEVGPATFPHADAPGGERTGHRTAGLARRADDENQSRVPHRGSLRCHPILRLIPEVFCLNISAMRSAMWAPASSGLVPSRWMLETQFRSDSGIPTRAW